MAVCDVAKDIFKTSNTQLEMGIPVCSWAIMIRSLEDPGQVTAAFEFLCMCWSVYQML